MIFYARYFCMALAVLALVSWAAPQTAHAAGLVGNIFNTDEQEYPDRGRLIQWTALKSRLQSGGDCQDVGNFCLPNAWAAKAEEIKAMPKSEQVAAVQKFINKMKFVEDRKNFGVADHWQTPSEFAKRGSGDCEDFTIAKMAMLQAVGYSQNAMRILILRNTVQNFEHAVLVVADAGGAVILDNLRRTVVTAEDVPEYSPIYSVNFDALWLHRTQMAGL